MGYIRHHAIVITGTGDVLKEAHTEATRLANEDPGCWWAGAPSLVSPITEGAVNGVRSFLVACDGSKEGWHESDWGDGIRDNVVRWLEAQRYADGSSPLAWVEVQYGDDNRETKVVRDSKHPLTVAESLR